MEGIDTLLRYISWGLVIIGPILLVSQLTRGNESTSDAVVGTVAALVGMVPEGLVLLTSIAFFVGALSLARRKVLVQELPAVEGLARVDVVCLDKTGTLTDGAITFAAMECVEGDGRGPGRRGHGGAWRTTRTRTRPSRRWPRRSRRRRPGCGPRPCRSRRPASGAAPPSTATGAGSWARRRSSSAPARPIPPSDPGSTRSSDAGQRVLLVAHADAPLEGEALPAGLARRRRPHVRGAGPPGRRGDDAVLRVARRRPQGHLGRQPADRRRPWPSGSVSPTSATPVDARTLPDDPAELAAAVNVTHGLRPCHPEPEAGLRPRPPAACPRRRHDR